MKSVANTFIRGTVLQQRNREQNCGQGRVWVLFSFLKNGATEEY